MLALLALVYVAALVVVWRDRRRARFRSVPVRFEELPEADRPPATAPAHGLPSGWLGVYVEEGLAAISAYLAQRGHGSTA